MAPMTRSQAKSKLPTMMKAAPAKATKSKNITIKHPTEIMSKVQQSMPADQTTSMHNAPPTHPVILSENGLLNLEKTPDHLVDMYVCSKPPFSHAYHTNGSLESSAMEPNRVSFVSLARSGMRFGSTCWVGKTLKLLPSGTPKLMSARRDACIDTANILATSSCIYSVYHKCVARSIQRLQPRHLPSTPSASSTWIL